MMHKQGLVEGFDIGLEMSGKETISSGRLSSMMMTLLSGMHTYSAKAPSRSTPTPLVSLHHWMLPVWPRRMGVDAAVDVKSEDLPAVMHKQGLVEGFDIGLGRPGPCSSSGASCPSSGHRCPGGSGPCR